MRLLTKPLYCSLVGLLNKLDACDSQRVTQSVVDCALCLLVELEQLDQVQGVLK